MRRRMMKSKIHRATVTDANLDYMGSISLDPKLMRIADMLEYEQVDGPRHRERRPPGDLCHRRRSRRGLPERCGGEAGAQR